MTLVNEDNTLSCVCFRCLDTGRIYTVTKTSFGDKGVDNAIDTLVRNDYERLSVKRYKLKKRFTNIEPINIFYEKTSNKRNKAKR